MSAAVACVLLATVAVACAIAYIIGDRDGWNRAMGYQRDAAAEHPLLQEDAKRTVPAAALRRRAKHRSSMRGPFR